MSGPAPNYAKLSTRKLERIADNLDADPEVRAAARAELQWRYLPQAELQRLAEDAATPPDARSAATSEIERRVQDEGRSGTSAQPQGPVQRVLITGVQIPFWDAAMILLKWSFAAVPTGLVWGVIWVIVHAFFEGT